MDDSDFKKKMGELRKMSRNPETWIKALEAGAHVIEGAAKVNVEQNFSEHSTGNLGNSIHVEVVSPTEVHVGSNAIHARIRELGGWIKPVFAKLLHWVDPDTGEHHTAKAVYQPPNSYLRKAVDESQGAIQDAIEAVIKKEIEDNLK